MAEAARLYGEVLRLDPRQFIALYGLGTLHYQTGHMEQAERLMAEAVRVNPSASECFFVRGCALQRLNRPNEALICFDRAIALKPDGADAYSNRGVVLMALNRHAEALDSLKTALALEPANAASWNNRGCVLVNLARYEDAIPCFDHALAQQPRFVQALINRGSAQAVLTRYAAAIADFEQVLAIDPQAPYAAGNLALYRIQSSDWRHYEEDKARLAEGVQAGRRVVMPFIHLALSDSPAEQLRCATIWAAHELPVQAPLWRDERYRHDRIRLAYVSADFHSHATAELMVGVFERHDRKQFEIFAFSFGRDDQSPMRARVANAFDHFIDVKGKSDYEVATLMRQLEIDIAIDLKGYTKQNRAGIFAHRPAPVQASYLGYPGSMGARFIDYIIADPIVVPDDQRGFYAERVVHLPDSYQCNTARPVHADPRRREDWGLPQGTFVFCCFSNPFKITPAIFAVWMRLLRAMPGSVLWLLEDNPESAANLRREAVAQDVPAERLVFAPRVSLDEHLARHTHADLFLDTQPYGAHTTASDALWAGVPVLTIAGPTFAARVAGSLLHAAGIPELVMRDIASYEAAALRLASDPATLDEIRTRLTRNRDSAPLFDTAAFTRNLENGFAAMWDRQRQGGEPESFAVNPDAGPSSEMQMPPPIADSAAAAFMQGCRLARENDLAGALCRLDDAVALAPRFVEALTNRGAILLALNRPADALASLDAAVAANPAMTEAWNNRGNALSSLGRYQEAVASFDRVLHFRPRQIEALINRGTALLSLRRPQEALTNYDQALQADAKSALALQGRANALFELKRFDEASAAYEAATAADPSRDVAGILAFSRLQCCDWRYIQNDRRLLSGANLRAGHVVDPFQYLAISQSAGDQRRCAELWTAVKHPPAPAPLWQGEDYGHQRLRVAWLSADFRNHPVARAMAGVWERLSRERFEHIAISWGAGDETELRTRIMRGFNDFRIVEGQSDDEIARQLRDMEIDIAIDLMGYTADCRPGILAARAVPVQASFLGFAGTMGAPWIDYLVADDIAVPDSERKNFTENIVHMSGSFFPLDNTRPVVPPASRSEAALPESGFVFACFNNSYKFTPEFFDIWMRLMREIEGSVLWLSAANAAAMRNLKREAELRGVDAGRLIFAPFLAEPGRHLARLAAADLFLDTLPYNAHATAADALYAGLPVLTCRGTTFAGRAAASLLHAAGLAELVTDNAEAYEHLALILARDPYRVREIRAKLAAARNTQPLFDTAAYAAKLESVLLALRKAFAP